MLMNRNVAGATLLLIAMLLATAVYAAEEISTWSTVKVLYNSNSGSYMQRSMPTRDDQPVDCPLQATSKPPMYAAQLPDGTWFSISELVDYVYMEIPDHSLWLDTGYLEWRANGFREIKIDDVGDRFDYREFWRWIKEHLSISISGVSVNLQIQGYTPSDCVYINWNWAFNTFEFGPCI
ncbi:MAG: hypothetical protein GY835_13290 [bacterium]|nr:hypothetical protein [bacterium]